MSGSTLQEDEHGVTILQYIAEGCMLLMDAASSLPGVAIEVGAFSNYATTLKT